MIVEPLRFAISALLLVAALPYCHGVLCSIYRTPSACDGKFTDSGGCAWDSEAGICAPSGQPLPDGTVAVTVVELDPQTAPPMLRPGPTSSSGSVGDPNLLSPDLRPQAPGGNVQAAEELPNPAPQEEDIETDETVSRLRSSSRDRTSGELSSIVGGRKLLHPQRGTPLLTTIYTA
jgi:hypothetical protein